MTRCTAGSLSGSLCSPMAREERDGRRFEVRSSRFSELQTPTFPVRLKLRTQNSELPVPLATRLDENLILRYHRHVHIITRKRLMEFARRHPDARAPLNYWFAIVRKTDYTSFAGLRVTFPAADQVGRFTVFNIGGNKFRLIVWRQLDLKVGDN